MKRMLLCAMVLAALGVAVVLSGAVQGPQAPSAGPKSAFQFVKQERNPVTHFRWNLEPDDFQFAIVSDRTGSHRANIFSAAVHKLNLLQPEFVLSVGDLIEGTKTVELLPKQWAEFDGYVAQLKMPFFYVPGNHDVASEAMTKFWADKLGRRHYHFVYHNVLFLILNSDDPPTSRGGIGQEQIAYAQKTLADNRNVRWTVVAVHRPLWAAANIDKNGWGPVEQALAGRNYTVFCGHVHRFVKYVRNGMNYYQLATTGGGSRLRGPEHGEFDHFVWVTMKKDGPIIANLMLDSVLPEDLRPPETNERGSKPVRKPVHPVRGQAFFEGAPIPGAQVVLTPVKDAVRADGVVAADGSFTLTTYKASDGAAAGEYTVTVTLREKDAAGKLGPNLLPAKYALPATSPLRATIAADKNELVLELRK